MDYAKLVYGASSVTLQVLKVYGLSEPDRVSKFHGIVHEMLDGTLAEQVAGGRRNIKIDFQTMTPAQRRKVVKWWLNTPQVVESVMTQLTIGVGAAEPGGSLPASKTIRYSARALDVIGGGQCATPANSGTTGSDNTVPVTITAISGARQYAIYRRNVTDGGNWLLIDYTTSLQDRDDGSITDADAVQDLGSTSDAILPAAADSINMIVPDDLVFQWGSDTELNRLLTIDGREASIFTTDFPV